MPNSGSDSTRPALDLLRSIAARGDGMSHRELFDDGWPTHAAVRLLGALRSRGYVRFDRATSRWVATESGRRRADEPRSEAPPTLSQR